MFLYCIIFRRMTVDSILDLNLALYLLFQIVIAEKESKIAEMEAASTGKDARFRAAVESVKGELAHLKSEHVCETVIMCGKLNNNINIFLRFHLVLQ